MGVLDESNVHVVIDTHVVMRYPTLVSIATSTDTMDTSAKKELTVEQLQRIEVSKKKAKEKLAAKEKDGASRKQRQQGSDQV